MNSPKSSNEIKNIAVIGAGLMGQGIAAVSLPLSKVLLKDVSEVTLTKAKENISAYLEKKSLTHLKGNLRTTTDDLLLRDCGLIIEAVYEDLELKRKILKEIESVVSSEAVFASNTSALPIGEVAAKAKHPERVLGMHYFSPVQKMPLLEIVVTPQTSPATVDIAKNYGIAQGKTVIVVKDSPGFYTTRILAPMLNEAILLLQDGASIEAIDTAMKEFGFPVGTLLLIDEVGIDVAAHVAEDLGKVFQNRWGQTLPTLRVLVEAGYLGKKNGKGFYKKDKTPNEEIYSFFEHRSEKTLSSEDISDRVAMMMINEAVYCLQESIIEKPQDGDIGAVMGLGFPSSKGGPFRYLDTLGLARAVNRMRQLSSQFGARFEPASLLDEKSKDGKKFYG